MQQMKREIRKSLSRNILICIIFGCKVKDKVLARKYLNVGISTVYGLQGFARSRKIATFAAPKQHIIK